MSDERGLVVLTLGYLQPVQAPVGHASCVLFEEVGGGFGVVRKIIRPDGEDADRGAQQEQDGDADAARVRQTR
ncbi:MAG: hypothetical protein ABF805_07435, partial [Bifidobacterium sp.]|uniref:hypothetical protein n=1 Tax=Bifidobacterium sp. TaxID=41200 RepID=UPI0039E9982B